MSLSAAAMKVSRASAAYEPPISDPVYQTVIALRGSDTIGMVHPETALSQTVSLPIRVVQTHYKPYQRARLLLEVLAPGAPTRFRRDQLLYVHVYKSAAEMHEEYQRIAGATEGPLFIADYCALAWPVAGAPGLETLHFCFDRRMFAQFLARHDFGPAQPETPELLRYVPRKRALFRWNAMRRYYLKCYEAGRDEPAADNLRLLAQAEGLRFDAPRPLAHDASRRALVMSEVPGAPLTGLIGNAHPEAFAAVGTALADLHGGKITPFGSWTRQRILDALLKAMADVNLALPSLSERLQEVLLKLSARMRALPADTLAPIHGNLFGDQILIGAERVGIVDWDDLGIGDPHYDLGRLLAHLIYVARRNRTPVQTAGLIHALLNAYVEASPRGGIHWPMLRLQIAAALLMRAKISALRMLPVGWTDDIASTIYEADRVLSGESQWLPG